MKGVDLVLTEVKHQLAKSTVIGKHAVSEHEKAAIQAIVMVEKVSEAVAHKRVTGEDLLVKKPIDPIIHMIISIYAAVKRYKSHGAMGENPLSMRDIKMFEEDERDLCDFEIACLLAIDDEVMKEPD